MLQGFDLGPIQFDSTYCCLIDVRYSKKYIGLLLTMYYNRIMYADETQLLFSFKNNIFLES